MKHNPDDRRDNVDKIQRNIDNTIRKMEHTEEIMEKTSDSNAKKDLREKNERREAALRGLRHEIKDEAEYSKNRRDQ